MSLFSGLYVGTTALKVASDALNTTSHNISNADTPGYTRQQVSQSTRHYNILSNATTKVAAKEIGMGVSYAAVSYTHLLVTPSFLKFLLPLSAVCRQTPHCSLHKFRFSPLHGSAP